MNIIVDLDQTLAQVRVLLAATADLPIEQVVGQVEGDSVEGDAATRFRGSLHHAAQVLEAKLKQIRDQLEVHADAVAAALAEFSAAEASADTDLNGLEAVTGMAVASDVVQSGRPAPGAAAAGTSAGSTAGYDVSATG
ncbi:MAG: hypothetical protein HGA44_06855 [Cellulomonadaceae bacterium]|nr:hypothetical protein [Cellulomonadaceae bacterium]